MNRTLSNISYSRADEHLAAFAKAIAHPEEYRYYDYSIVSRAVILEI